MAITISGTDGIVGAGFTLDASGASVTAGVGTFSSLNASASGLTGALPALDAANLTSIPAANIVGVCTSGLSKTGGFGKFSSYALLAKVHDSGTSTTYFGTYTTGAWRTRDIDTEVSDEDGIVTISSNQFTLQAGNYRIRYGATSYTVDKHALRLRNVTDTSTVGYGVATFGYSYSPILFTEGTVRVSIASAKAFEVQGYPAVTKASNGMGFAMVNGSSYETIVEIFKEA